MEIEAMADRTEKHAGRDNNSEDDTASRLVPGLYEQVISHSLAGKLSRVPDVQKSVSKIDEGEAAQVLSQYVSKLVEKKLTVIEEEGGDIQQQIRLINDVVKTLDSESTAPAASADTDASTAAPAAPASPAATPSASAGNAVDPSGEQLLALLSSGNPRLAASQRASDLPRPQTSIAGSSLFTGADREPQLYSELEREIASCDGNLRDSAWRIR